MKPSVVSAGGVLASVALLRVGHLLPSGRAAMALIEETVIGGAVGLIALLWLDTQLRSAVVGMAQRLERSESLPKDIV